MKHPAAAPHSASCVWGILGRLLGTTFPKMCKHFSATGSETTQRELSFHWEYWELRFGVKKLSDAGTVLLPSRSVGSRAGAEFGQSAARGNRLQTIIVPLHQLLLGRLACAQIPASFSLQGSPRFA